MTTRPWLERAQRNAGWLVAVGALEIALGILALLSPLASGLAATVALGAALLIGGFARLIASFGARSFGAGAAAFAWSFILALTGVHLLVSPASGLLALTLVLGLFLFASGLIESYIALRIRPAGGWAWLLAGGTLSIVLALMVWTDFPVSGSWLVGTAIGVHLLLNGISTVAIGTAARRVTTRVRAGQIETGVVGPAPSPAPRLAGRRANGTGDDRLAS
jgi:uncharacterized membrane protein HdeD (DUF308 family)